MVEKMGLCLYMSPVSPVFHTVETVRLFLNLKGTNPSTPDMKTSMLEPRAPKFFYFISYPARKTNLVLSPYSPFKTG